MAQACIPGGPGTIVIGYRGTFAFGRDGLADVKFRKLTRILVHGRVSTFFYFNKKLWYRVFSVVDFLAICWKC